MVGSSQSKFTSENISEFSAELDERALFQYPAIIQKVQNLTAPIAIANRITWPFVLTFLLERAWKGGGRLARRARSFKQELVGRINQLRSPGNLRHQPPALGHNSSKDGSGHHLGDGAYAGDSGHLHRLTDSSIEEQPHYDAAQKVKKLYIWFFVPYFTVAFFASNKHMRLDTSNNGFTHL